MTFDYDQSPKKSEHLISPADSEAIQCTLREAGQGQTGEVRFVLPAGLAKAFWGVIETSYRAGDLKASPSEALADLAGTSESDDKPDVTFTKKEGIHPDNVPLYFGDLAAIVQRRTTQPPKVEWLEPTDWFEKLSPESPVSPETFGLDPGRYRYVQNPGYRSGHYFVNRAIDEGLRPFLQTGNPRALAGAHASLMSDGGKNTNDGPWVPRGTIHLATWDIRGFYPSADTSSPALTQALAQDCAARLFLPQGLTPDQYRNGKYEEDFVRFAANIKAAEEAQGLPSARPR